MSTIPLSSLLSSPAKESTGAPSPSSSFVPSKRGGDISTLAAHLLTLTAPIRAPYEDLTDSDYGRVMEETLRNASSIDDRKRLINRIRASLKLEKCRQACFIAQGRGQVSLQKDLAAFTRSIAVAKCGVGRCGEKSNTLLFALMREDNVDAYTVTILHPVRNTALHQFLFLSTQETPFDISKYLGGSLENFLRAPFRPYLVDPLLKWHGDALSYGESPLKKYVEESRISVIKAFGCKPDRKFIEEIEKESNRISQAALRIVPELEDEGFLDGRALRQFRNDPRFSGIL